MVATVKTDISSLDLETLECRPCAGPPTVLTSEEELATYIVDMSDMGFDIILHECVADVIAVKLGS